MNSELQNKLKELRISLGFQNQTLFAEKLGVSQGTIANIESGNREVSKPMLLKIKEVFDIDLLSWQPEEEKKSISGCDNIISIPFYDVAASAGKGETLPDYQQKECMVFDRRLLKHILKRDTFDSLQIIHASGDSMDSGWNQPDDIKDGDLLMVDTAQTTGNNQTFVILVNNSELRVKRLFKRGETLFISSNNPKYKEEVYCPDNSDIEVKVIGKVVWHFSGFNS